MQEHEQKFHIVCRNVRVSHDLLLSHEEASQLYDFSKVLLSHHSHVATDVAEPSIVVLVYHCKQELRQVIHQLSSLTF